MTVPLTKTEIKVLQHMAYGLSEARIARVLVVEQATVKTHLNRAYKKLGAERAGRHGLKPCVVAIRRALHEGIIQFPPLPSGQEDAH